MRLRKAVEENSCGDSKTVNVGIAATHCRVRYIEFRDDVSWECVHRLFALYSVLVSRPVRVLHKWIKGGSAFSFLFLFFSFAFFLLFSWIFTWTSDLAGISIFFLYYTRVKRMQSSACMMQQEGPACMMQQEGVRPRNKKKLEKLASMRDTVNDMVHSLIIDNA